MLILQKYKRKRIKSEMCRLGIQYLLQVKRFVFIFFAVYAPVLFNGCKQAINRSRVEMLDRIEALMFQQPENLDSLLDKIDTTGITPHEQARMNTIRGVIQYDRGEFDKCINYLERAETFYLSEEDHYHSSITKLIRAFVFEYLKLADNAAGLYIECEEYFAKHHQHKFKFYASLGLLRMSEQLALDRKTLFERLRQDTDQLKEPIYKGLLYTAIGGLEKNDSLKISYYEEAKADFIEAHRWSGVYTMELNILFAKIKQDPSETTQIYYDHFPVKEYLYTPTPQQHIRYLYGQAYLLAKQRKDKRAIEVTNQVLKEAVALNIPSAESDCIQLLSVLYKHIRDYRNAQQMLERYHAMKERDLAVMRRNQVLALGAHYRYSELEREKLDLKIQVQRSLLIMAVMGLVFVIVFLIIWISLKESKYKQKILKLKNIEIGEQISNLLCSLKAQKEENTDLIRHVESFKVQYHDTQEISELLKAIDQKQIATWMEYEAHFQHLRPGWIEKLKQEVPKLTSTDLKYCMCLYFNLNNYAIANLLGVGDEAVKSAKKRIRDKFSLDEATEIYLYLKKND